MVRTFDFRTRQAGSAYERPCNQEKRSGDPDEEGPAAVGGPLRAAHALRGLLRDDAGMTHEQALRHLGEDGLTCTRAEYEAAWESLHGGEDARGRRRRPPGAAGPPESQREPEPAEAPAESEDDVSESNGHTAAAPANRNDVARRLRQVVLRLGRTAGTAQIVEAARAEGLEVSRAQTLYAYQQAFPGAKRVGGRQAGGGAQVRQPVDAPPAVPEVAPPAPPAVQSPPAPQAPAADPLRHAIGVLLDKLRAQEAQAARTRDLVNGLCEAAGVPPMFTQAQEAS